MDADVANILNGTLGRGVNRDSDLTAVVDRSLTQGLGVIQNVLIQQGGGVADDAAQYAAFNTASRIPQSGAIPTT